MFRPLLKLWVGTLLIGRFQPPPPPRSLDAVPPGRSGRPAELSALGRHAHAGGRLWVYLLDHLAEPGPASDLVSHELEDDFGQLRSVAGLRLLQSGHGHAMGRILRPQSARTAGHGGRRATVVDPWARRVPLPADQLSPARGLPGTFRRQSFLFRAAQNDSGRRRPPGAVVTRARKAAAAAAAFPDLPGPGGTSSPLSGLRERAAGAICRFQLRGAIWKAVGCGRAQRRPTIECLK